MNVEGENKSDCGCWSYRVLRTRAVDDGTSCSLYQVHEVYCDTDGTLNDFSDGPVVPCGNSLLELQQDLQLVINALQLPVLHKNTDGKHILEYDADWKRSCADECCTALMNRLRMAEEFINVSFRSDPLLRFEPEIKRLISTIEDCLDRLYRLAGPAGQST